MSAVVETAAPEGGDRPSALADLLSGLFWIAFGAAIVVGSWKMERFVAQGATLFSMPGLVPGLLGGSIAVMGAMLAFRAARQGAVGPGQPSLWPGWNRELLLAIGFFLAYALGLVGRAPFWLATFLFVAGFIGAFEWRARGERGQRLRGLVVAAVSGACTSAAVSLVFEQVFLVRLP